MFMLNIALKKKRQQTTALSTMEAEYMALTAATQEAIFLRQLLQDMGERQSDPTMICEDNKSCIAMCKNMMTKPRSKHIDIKYHFCREKMANGEISVSYCASEDMLADMMTKPLPSVRHARLALMTMVSSSE